MINNGDGQHPALDTVTRITITCRLRPVLIKSAVVVMRAVEAGTIRRHSRTCRCEEVRLGAVARGNGT
jgi:hypothetical protein